MAEPLRDQRASIPEPDAGLLPFLAKLGSGPHGSRHLDRAEAYQLGQRLLTEAFHPTSFGAVGIAYRFVGISAEELAGILDALAERYPAPVGAPRDALDCAGAFDGKVRTLRIVPAAALTAAGAGLPVLLHGAHGVPTKYGLTDAHLLEALGIEVAATPEAAVGHLREAGLTYLHQARYAPGLWRLLPLRRHVGKRTFVNTLEPLVNPLGLRRHLGSYFHRPYAERVAGAAALARRGFTRALFTTGIEGSVEVRPTKGVLTRRTPEGELIDEPIALADLVGPVSLRGLAAPREGGLEANRTASREATLRYLEGQWEDDFGRIAIGTAASMLLAGERVRTLAEGVEAAVVALRSGAAADRLDRWRTVAPLREGIQGLDRCDEEEATQ